ncbi:MAG: alpha amylase C-terminal domain-containing protein, partial [Bacteroidales bacterium]|nr:alpha amylase C-terminal domain-containing protein [Bacteroidales bacterium]
DLIHSHAVKNVLEGLNLYAGNPGQFFHKGPRRNHPAWDSLCYDYGKPEVIHFLLSNCKFWMEEYKIDGFRFDGVTSMLYTHHGLNRNFTEYAMYFDGSEDPDAMAYLMMANRLIHEIRPEALTIAEEMSGMPGIATPFEALGFGFDYRLAMGIPDYWIQLIKEVPDETWDVGNLYYELTRKREDEKTIGYSESHDQALVGDQTLIFRLIGSDMYDGMRVTDRHLIVDRGIALHKLIKLMTLATAGNGYLNFMGNEFGHPEWIDFPREGNGWSYQYARRQWSLMEDESLRFHQLRDFDRMLIEKIGQAEHFYDAPPVLIHDNKPEQVLAFKRSGLLFVFNLNPQKSFTRYEIETGAGKYKIVLSTDDAEFGGFDRIDRTMTYFTTSPVPNKRMINTLLSLYLPSRCGIVLREEKTKGIYTLLSGD